MIPSPYPIIITSNSNNLYCTFSYKTFFFQCQLLSIPPISPHTGTSLTFSQLSFPSHIFHLPQTSQQYTPYTLILHSIPSFPTTSFLLNLKSVSPNSSLHYIHCNPPYLPTLSSPHHITQSSHLHSLSPPPSSPHRITQSSHLPSLSPHSILPTPPYTICTPCISMLLLQPH